MRPLKLTLSAFGPFKDEVTIDFRAFSDQPLFLISGPTGSGKTTIFDALTYALYGEASGQVRDVDGLKSQYADDSQLAYVDFTFDNLGQTYRVKRIPAQRGPSAKGRIKNYPSTEVTLEGPGLALSGVTDVNEKITELIGLDVKQFRQIVLLPQGEFRQLIDAKSKDREAIFRNIFHTQPLQLFEERLKGRLKELSQEEELSRARLSGVLDQIEAKDNFALEEALAAGQEDKVLEVLQEQIASDQEDQDKIDGEIKDEKAKKARFEAILTWLKDRQAASQRLQSLQAKEADMDQVDQALKDHGQAQILMDLCQEASQLKAKAEATQRSLAETKKAIGDLKDQQARQHEEFIQVQASYQGLEDKEERLDQLAELGRLAKDLQAAQKDLKDLRDRWQAASQEAEKDDQELKAIDQQVKEAEKVLEDLDQVRDQDLPDLRDQVQALAKQKKDSQDQLEKLIAYQEAIQDQKAYRQRYLEEEAVYEKEEAKYQTLRKAYYRNLAGILAQDLEEEVPCPVCGSLDHPQPAQMTDQVSQEEVDDQGKVRDQASSRLAEVRTLASQAHKKVQDQQVKLEVEPDHVDEALAQVQKQVDQLQAEELQVQAKLDEATSRLASYSDQQAAVKKLQADQKNFQIKGQVFDDQAQTFASQEVQLQEKIQELKDHFDQDQTVADLEAAHEALKNEIQEIKKDFEVADAKRQAIDKDLATQEARLKEQIHYQKERQDEWQAAMTAYDQALEKSPFQDDFADHLLEAEKEKDLTDRLATYRKEIIEVESLYQASQAKLQGVEDLKSVSDYEEALGYLDASLTEKEDQIRTLYVRLTRQKQAADQIQAYLEDHDRLSQNYAVVKELSDIANGQDQRTQKVSFERYVLGIYFEEILQAANRRLLPMTHNRYQLRRKTTLSKGNAKQGLDMEILDEYTGQARDVSTLSGGESFKTSLSLALAMSDVLQSQQGATRVQTLFIDEGFGSLDAESLDTAIEVLIDLNSDGRLIGIISHVEELKTRIPAQIHVYPTKQGSDLDVRVY